MWKINPILHEIGEYDNERRSGDMMKRMRGKKKLKLISKVILRCIRRRRNIVI